MKLLGECDQQDLYDVGHVVKSSGGILYMVVCVGDEYSLINLKDGYAVPGYDDQIKYHSIEELKKMIATRSDKLMAGNHIINFDGDSEIEGD